VKPHSPESSSCEIFVSAAVQIRSFAQVLTALTDGRGCSP
jgi:hypothetical protein